MIPIPAAPPAPPSFQREVLPILRTACIGCHSAANPAGGITLSSWAELLKGGRNGAAIVPGKAGESRLVKMLTGAVKPQMPPGPGLKASDIDIIRRWVDAGAKNDAPVAAPAIPGKPGAIKTTNAALPISLGPRRNVPAPINALAFSPDGKTLAVGAYQRVLLCDPTTRQITTVWTGHSDAVRSVMFSPDGRWLAAGGGTSGARGEVRLWSIPARRETRAFANQGDTVNAVAFSPDSKTLASASADRSIQIWDPIMGRPLQTLRDHADAVLGLAFRADGKYLLSGGADKSVKVWDTATWRRLYSIGASEEPVTAVASAPGNGPFLTASTDRVVKVWNFGAESSNQARALGGHGNSIWSVALSPDGQFAASASADKTVKVWNVGNGANTATFTDPKDWVYVVRFSPDGKHLAAGTWNGMVYLWNVETKTLEGTISTVPMGQAGH
jgi:WD40 repeat protein